MEEIKSIFKGKFYLLLLLLFLSSCNKDDVSNNPLIGKWKWTSGGTVEYLTFNSDGTCKDEIVGEYTTTFIYSYDDTTKKLTMGGAVATIKWNSSTEIIMNGNTYIKVN